MTKSDKHRAYCFTDFILDIKFYESLEFDYIVLGEELCPKTQKLHWQGYIRFKNPRDLKAIIKKFKPRHIECCKGSEEDNIKYCTKDNKIILEKGDRKKQGQRNDLEIWKNDIKAGMPDNELLDKHPSNTIRYQKALSFIRKSFQPERNWKTEIIILWGPPGTGKTRKAIEMGGQIIEYDNGFILGYKNQEIIIFDDFDGQIPYRLLLKLTDRYPFTVNIKGGDMTWNPRKIIFTSNTPIESWYDDTSALKRRVDSSVELLEQKFGTEVS